VLPGAGQASADGPPTDSAMTVSGKGEFANLQVTVGQTKNLINQVITVTWKGGVLTTPPTAFAANFLQIMQCWGDDPAGPDRTQCQFGTGSVGSLAPGNWVTGRQVQAAPVDPKETLKLSPGQVGQAYVPFWPAGRDKPTVAATGNRNDFFDIQVTNEVPLARTYGDGTGLQYFEVQTVRQAAGLGCGDPITTGGAVVGRKCWLVVVPRGSTEVDGTPRRGDNANPLTTSPLSQSNWDKRIVFPLEFQPVGQACPIGSPERRMVGHELAVDAISHWQPTLCAGNGPSFAYTQLPDDVVRSQVVDGSSPGLALVTNPVPPDQAPPDRPLVYAPVGLSGLAIAFNIEHQPPANAPSDKLQLAGQRFTSMKLTPRLVAKLLTQSYLSSVVGYPLATPDYLKNNPVGLTRDPEFLTLNPEYTDFAQYNTPPDALVQLPGSDLTSLLWSWVKADPEASAFIAGTPDKAGMVVNPNNKGLTLPTSTFPLNDQGCVEVNINGTVTGRSCTLDIHPFTNDMHDSGLAASRGDSKTQIPVLAADNTPVLGKQGRQLPGQRALLAVVDAATAARYGLPTADLFNTAGKFVPLDTASLLAGERAMKPSPVPGVLTSDPSATDPAAYPLTALSYAVASPSTLDSAAGKDYATFLRYAAGDGQQVGVAPGQLPFGMVPLPDTLKAQTLAAALTVETEAGQVPGGPPVPQATPAVVAGAGSGATEDLTGGSSTAAGPGGTATKGGGGSGPVAPTTTQNPSGPDAKSPNTALQPAGVRGRTPPLPAPIWVGGVLLATLICGGLAAMSSPVLQSPVIDRLRAAVLRRVRKEVMPGKR
ncbi:MAG: hypothetical protein ACRDS0_32830, partial [Pseudonocardiaceae bacterium]